MTDNENPDEMLDKAKVEFKLIIEKLNALENPEDKVATLYQAITFTYEFTLNEIDVINNNMKCSHNQCKLYNLMKILNSSRDIITNGLIPLLHKHIENIEEEESLKLVNNCSDHQSKMN